jgi:hypothetical protein
MVAGATGAQGCNGASYLLHPSKNIDIYIYIFTYVFTVISGGETKKRERGEEGLSPTGWCRSLVLLAARGCPQEEAAPSR